MQEPAISVRSIKVSASRISLEVVLSEKAPKRTSSTLIDAALERFPNLGAHTCINSKGPTFSSVMYDTSVPHLFEHLVIDIQVSDEDTPEDASFKGTSRWLDEDAGIAKVEVSMLDDVVAMRAVNAALSFLNEILSSDNMA